ncbi:S-adenosylmethionine synthetase [Mesoplasma florum L1]|uniref:S-adenosylmethionine synthase n=1 Tax=Mesoplasma florum (strain ATCC 33453 / NBRC 100688 / NCTC 11704 / L1) TaxID=265311 RepID=METK_MESFL|nr:methionine adenosyltransferase [Mesoplasma florum]Q6F1M6.1 RecName: Full=S-adenosylmethionine synthase; Short=AdoMet synthase; AltName: Full=MAT; AltName: Full=Methionine adenosyltransferase [Mesoplasma florum L1]AAT75597.1 S-adenosylmethionine synthetase [Mesoplasma florum L1]ATI73882.1 S-adenosylmethionine synthase [Mesoplasma florum]
MRKLFTSESVSEGHPDKICDQISDAILDEVLKQDPNAKVACETFATTNYLLIGGQITTTASVDYEKIARDVLRKIGYNNDAYGINADTCKIDIRVEQQSADIALGIDLDTEVIGAGDQGIMFGYATNESKTFLPLAITISHELVYLASKLRKEGKFKWARPDMKSQVTIDYTDESNPKIDTILMSIQHDDEMIEEEFKKFIKSEIMDVVAKEFELNTDFNVLINPTGRFVIGGPQGDTGLTGRKIIVDTYGGYSRHGGGAFSGKDATKVDRSAAYMARYAAKNLVASGLADKIEIQVSYAIGKPEPVSIFIETFGTEKVSKEVIAKALNENFDFSVNEIIKKLDLRKPTFLKTATYGHFGKDEFTWEQLDKVKTIKK